MIDSYFEVGKIYDVFCEHNVYKAQCIDTNLRKRFKFIDNFTINSTRIKEFDAQCYYGQCEKCYANIGNRSITINPFKVCFKTHYVFKRNFETTTFYNGREYKIKVHINKKNTKAYVSVIDGVGVACTEAICYLEHKQDINNPDVLIDSFYFNGEKYEGDHKYDLFYPGSIYTCNDGDLLFVLQRFVDDMLTVKTSKCIANVYIDKLSKCESISDCDIQCTATAYRGEFKDV